MIWNDYPFGVTINPQFFQLTHKDTTCYILRELEFRSSQHIRQSAGASELISNPQEKEGQMMSFKGIFIFSISSLALLLSGCTTYQHKVIAPETVSSAWANIGPEEATQLLSDSTNETPLKYNLSDGISLKEAEVTALFYNPALSASRISSGLPEVQKKYARLWEDPELEIDGEYFSSIKEDSLNYSGGLALTIPLSGRLDVQKEIAEASLAVQKASIIAEEWALVVEIREKWAERHFLLEKAKVLKEMVTDHEKTLKMIPHFRAAKVATIIDEQNLKIEKEELEDEQLKLELELKNNHLILLRLMGLHPDGNWSLTIDSKEIARSFSSNLQQKNLLLSNPNLQKVLGHYEVAQLHLKLVIKRQIPDLKIGLGAGTEDSSSLMAFGLGLSHLPIFNRNRLDISVSEIERKKKGEEILISVQNLMSQRASAYQRLEIANHRIKNIKTRLLPLAIKQVWDAMRLAKSGELDLFLLVEAIKKKGETKLTLLETELEMSYANLQGIALSGPDFSWNTTTIAQEEFIKRGN